MTKNHICSNDFPEIIDTSWRFKESRTNLNVSEQFKNSSDSKKIKCYKEYQEKYSEKYQSF